MKEIEKKAADENTTLQIQGAIEQLSKAREALENALRLGGNINSLPGLLPIVGSVAREVQMLIAVTCYRQKYNFADAARILGLKEEEVLRLLLQHFESRKELAHAWLTAEVEIQGLPATPGFPSRLSS